MREARRNEGLEEVHVEGQGVAARQEVPVAPEPIEESARDRGRDAGVMDPILSWMLPELGPAQKVSADALAAVVHGATPGPMYHG